MKKAVIPTLLINKPTIDYYRAKSNSLPEAYPNQFGTPSVLGTVMYDTLKLYCPKHIDWDFETERDSMELELKNVSIRCSISKNINLENITGNGTFKQMIGQDDLIVSVKGKLTTKTNFKPYEDAKKLAYILRAPVTLNVTCRCINDNFGLFNFVVLNFDEFDSKPDTLNSYDFSFTMYSDSEEIITILEENQNIMDDFGVLA